MAAAGGISASPKFRRSRCRGAHRWLASARQLDDCFVVAGRCRAYERFGDVSIVRIAGAGRALRHVAITRSASTPSPLKERSRHDVEANAAVERCRSRTQWITHEARLGRTPAPARVRNPSTPQAAAPPPSPHPVEAGLSCCPVAGVILVVAIGSAGFGWRPPMPVRPGAWMCGGSPINATARC
jgi:hypothetical protein